MDQIDNLTSNLSGKTACTSSTTTNTIMSELENLENEHDLWRWYTQIYLIEILEPPGGLIHFVSELLSKNKSKLKDILGNFKILYFHKIQIICNKEEIYFAKKMK